jgi:hypothetical protein
MMIKFFAIVIVVLSIFTTEAQLRGYFDPSSIMPKMGCEKTTAARCDPPADLDYMEQEGLLKSAGGEDKCLIKNFFPRICNGKYLEVGALDGIRDSNTYAFYEYLGWRGVNIELDPDNFDALAYNRRKDIANVHAAVCSDSQQTVHYAIGKDDRATSGLYEYASDAHKEQHWSGTKYNTIPMKCTPLQSIFDKTVGRGKYFFDLAVFDTEGSEFAALLSIDYGRISFGVIIIERNEEKKTNQKIRDLLSMKGYIESTQQYECGYENNMLFIHQNFSKIYAQLGQ